VVLNTGRSSTDRISARTRRETGVSRPHRLASNNGDRVCGSAATVPSPVGRSRDGRPPNGCRPGRSLHRVPRNADGDEHIHAHNTLSAENTKVQVFYPFHPLHGATLQMVRRSKRGDGAASVMDPMGKRLKIPVWMLWPDCAQITITDKPHLSKEALLSLTTWVSPPLGREGPVHDNLQQTAVDGCEGGRRDAITTSGPDDPRGKRGRAEERRGTRRADRSHGPRADSGLSRKRRKR